MGDSGHLLAFAGDDTKKRNGESSSPGPLKLKTPPACYEIKNFDILAASRQHLDAVFSKLPDQWMIPSSDPTLSIREERHNYDCDKQMAFGSASTSIVLQATSYTGHGSNEVQIKSNVVSVGRSLVRDLEFTDQHLREMAACLPPAIIVGSNALFYTSQSITGSPELSLTLSETLKTEFDARADEMASSGKLEDNLFSNMYKSIPSLLIPYTQLDETQRGLITSNFYSKIWGSGSKSQKSMYVVHWASQDYEDFSQIVSYNIKLSKKGATGAGQLTDLPYAGAVFLSTSIPNKKRITEYDQMLLEQLQACGLFLIAVRGGSSALLGSVPDFMRPMNLSDEEWAQYKEFSQLLSQSQNPVALLNQPPASLAKLGDEAWGRLRDFAIDWVKKKAFISELSKSEWARNGRADVATWVSKTGTQADASLGLILQDIEKHAANFRSHEEGAREELKHWQHQLANAKSHGAEFEDPSRQPGFMGMQAVLSLIGRGWDFVPTENADISYAYNVFLEESKPVQNAFNPNSIEASIKWHVKIKDLPSGMAIYPEAYKKLLVDLVQKVNAERQNQIGQLDTSKVVYNENTREFIVSISSTRLYTSEGDLSHPVLVYIPDCIAADAQPWLAYSVRPVPPSDIGVPDENPDITIKLDLPSRWAIQGHLGFGSYDFKGTDRKSFIMLGRNTSGKEILPEEEMSEYEAVTKYQLKSLGSKFNLPGLMADPLWYKQHFFDMIPNPGELALHSRGLMLDLLGTAEDPASISAAGRQVRNNQYGGIIQKQFDVTYDEVRGRDGPLAELELHWSQYATSQATYEWLFKKTTEAPYSNDPITNALLTQWGVQKDEDLYSTIGSAINVFVNVREQPGKDYDFLNFYRNLSHEVTSSVFDNRFAVALRLPGRTLSWLPDWLDVELAVSRNPVGTIPGNEGLWWGFEKGTGFAARVLAYIVDTKSPDQEIALRFKLAGSAIFSEGLRKSPYDHLMLADLNKAMSALEAGNYIEAFRNLTYFRDQLTLYGDPQADSEEFWGKADGSTRGSVYHYFIEEPNYKRARAILNSFYGLAGESYSGLDIADTSLPIGRNPIDRYNYYGETTIPADIPNIEPDFIDFVVRRRFNLNALSSLFSSNMPQFDPEAAYIELGGACAVSLPPSVFPSLVTLATPKYISSGRAEEILRSELWGFKSSVPLLSYDLMAAMGFPFLTNGSMKIATGLSGVANTGTITRVEAGIYYARQMSDFKAGSWQPIERLAGHVVVANNMPFGNTQMGLEAGISAVSPIVLNNLAWELNAKMATDWLPAGKGTFGPNYLINFKLHWYIGNTEPKQRVTMPGEAGWFDFEQAPSPLAPKNADVKKPKKTEEAPDRRNEM